MTTPTSDLCPSCFGPLPAGRLPCATCGFHGAEPQPRKDGELALGALLRERYAIGRVLGRGGFGITYLAYDTRLRRRRAIKEYFPRGVVTREMTRADVSVVSGQTVLYASGMEKYLEEARLLAQFEDHPCIVSPLDFFEENQTAYLVMEYLEGETLRSYVARSGGRISYETALHILSPVIEALETVHRAGILHRDVSPDNIFLTVKGEAKLLDFGAARQRMVDSSASMTVILREHYAPPEQYTKSGRQGSWTDVYAFAATFYMSITGHSPPPAPERLMQDRIEWPSRLGVSIPPLAEQALMRALAVRIEERPQRIDELTLSLAGKRPDASGAEQSPLRSLGESLGAWLARLADSARYAAERLGTFMTPERTRAALLTVGAAALFGVASAGVWRWATSPASETEVAVLPEPAPREEVPVLPPPQRLAEREIAPEAPVSPEPVSPEPEPAAPPEAKPDPAPASVPELATLRIRSNVSGDRLLIDGTAAGSTGATVHRLAPGKHRIRVEKDGYVPVEREVELAAGQPLRTVHADLKREGAGPGERFELARRALASPDPEQWRGAADELRAVAELGHAPAQRELGLVLAEGRGKRVPVEDAAALAWLAKAAGQGDLSAQYMLGLGLEFGRVPKGARDGAPPTPFVEERSLLGRMFRADKDFLELFHGHTTGGNAEQLKQAYAWHMKAAQRGHAGAQERVGYMLASGRGSARRPNEAFYWLQKAALGGRAEAQYALGMCYLLGEGYAANPEAAGCWLREASRAGHERARAQLKRMDLDEGPGPTKSGPACNFAPFGAP
jgi:serine/threonine protein kinase/TPR repeat protein